MIYGPNTEAEAEDYGNALVRAEHARMRAEEQIDRLVAPNTWRWADGSEVGIPEGAFIVSGISAAESIDEAMPWNAVSDDDDGLGAALDGEG